MTAQPDAQAMTPERALGIGILVVVLLIVLFVLTKHVI